MTDAYMTKILKDVPSIAYLWIVSFNEQLFQNDLLPVTIFLIEINQNS